MPLRVSDRNCGHEERASGSRRINLAPNAIKTMCGNFRASRRSADIQLQISHQQTNAVAVTLTAIAVVEIGAAFYGRTGGKALK